jgi:hypothetical protein
VELGDRCAPPRWRCGHRQGDRGGRHPRCGGRAPSGAHGQQRTVTRTLTIQGLTFGSAYANRKPAQAGT